MFSLLTNFPAQSQRNVLFTDFTVASNQIFKTISPLVTRVSAKWKLSQFSFQNL